MKAWEILRDMEENCAVYENDKFKYKVADGELMWKNELYEHFKYSNLRVNELKDLKKVVEPKLVHFWMFKHREGKWETKDFSMSNKEAEVYQMKWRYKAKKKLRSFDAETGEEVK